MRHAQKIEHFHCLVGLALGHVRPNGQVCEYCLLLHFSIDQSFPGRTYSFKLTAREQREAVLVTFASLYLSQLSIFPEFVLPNAFDNCGN
jgi:hypothetical protein